MSQANEGTVGPLTALSVSLMCMVGFAWRANRLDYVQLLDGRHFYSAEDVSNLFVSLGGDWWIYLVTELTLDMIFPVAYAMLLSRAISWLTDDLLAWLPGLVWAVATLDVVENLLISAMLLFAESVSSVAVVASYTTMSKWLLLGFVLLVTLLLVISQLLALERINEIPERGGSNTGP